MEYPTVTFDFDPNIPGQYSCKACGCISDEPGLCQECDEAMNETISNWDEPWPTMRAEREFIFTDDIPF